MPLFPKYFDWFSTVFESNCHIERAERSKSEHTLFLLVEEGDATGCSVRR